jgi:hypothetical protein
MERDTGADLYVGIEVQANGMRETKGFLVQAKFQRNLRSFAERHVLSRQCRDMSDRTDAGYVWLYDHNRVRVLRAQQVLDSPDDQFQNLHARRASTLFTRTLECSEGARELGLPNVQGRAQMRSELGVLLQDLRAARGVAVSIRQT